MCLSKQHYLFIELYSLDEMDIMDYVFYVGNFGRDDRVYYCQFSSCFVVLLHLKQLILRLIQTFTGCILTLYSTINLVRSSFNKCRNYFPFSNEMGHGQTLGINRIRTCGRLGDN